MNRFIIKIFVILLAIGLWDIGFFEPLASDLGGQVSVAEASHRDGGSSRFCQRFPSLCERMCRRNPSFCQPPTVSELPIQYMILSGAALISLCGGMAYYIRKQKLKSSPGGVMNKITLKLFIFFLALNLWNLGFFEPLASGLGGEVTLAEAHHKPWHTSGGGGNCKKNPKKCQPPTVSELPIQYMILSGIAVITLSGGMAFFIRKRRMKNSLEV